MQDEALAVAISALYRCHLGYPTGLFALMPQSSLSIVLILLHQRKAHTQHKTWGIQEIHFQYQMKHHLKSLATSFWYPTLPYPVYRLRSLLIRIPAHRVSSHVLSCVRAPYFTSTKYLYCTRLYHHGNARTLQVHLHFSSCKTYKNKNDWKMIIHTPYHLWIFVP